MSSPGLLEVTVRGERDVAGAEEGGADRLQLAAAGGLSPEPALVTTVCRATDLPMRVVLRLNDSYTTTGGELTRLVGLGGEFLDRGAAGLVFGFLDRDLEVDLEVCALIAQSAAAPWTFHRAIDAALDPGRAWRQVSRLPHLDAVLSAGSPRGLEHGFEDLLARVRADPAIAALALPGGGLVAEQVPWLVRAGVRQFHLGPQVRPGGTYERADVDPALVRSWRLLLDDAVAHTQSSPASTVSPASTA